MTRKFYFHPANQICKRNFPNVKRNSKHQIFIFCLLLFLSWMNVVCIGGLERFWIMKWLSYKEKFSFYWSVRPAVKVLLSVPPWRVYWGRTARRSVVGGCLGSRRRGKNDAWRALIGCANSRKSYTALEGDALDVERSRRLIPNIPPTFVGLANRPKK